MSKTLPRGWQEVKLQECLLEQPKYGMNAPAVKYDNSLPTYIRITDIDEYGNFINDNKVSVNNENYEEYILNDNDFLFARTGASVGKTYLYNKKDGTLVFAGYLIKVKPNQNILNSLFLKYYTQSKRYWDFVKITSTRTGQPGINGKEYANMNIILPPLEEQKHIAEVLSLCDEVIENLTELIEKKEQYKKGVMQRLLSGEVRFKGFTDEWKNTTLNEVIKEKTVKNKNNKINLVLSVTNKDGFVIQNEFFGKTIASKDLSNYKIVDKWDFAYNPARVNVGSISMLENFDVCIVSPMYVVFSINHEIIYKYFLKYWIQSHNFNGYIKSLSAGSVRSILSFDAMSTMKIKVPSLEEQKKIAGLLSAIDDEIENFKKQLELRKQQKKGLMQRLLTGEVRI